MPRKKNPLAIGAFVSCHYPGHSTLDIEGQIVCKFVSPSLGFGIIVKNDAGLMRQVLFCDWEVRAL